MRTNIKHNHFRFNAPSHVQWVGSFVFEFSDYFAEPIAR